MKRAARRTALAGSALAAVSLITIAGCGSAGRAASASTLAQWQRDSTRYELAKRAWVRDSTVKDSIARSIRSDTLLALYVAQYTAPHPEELLDPILCVSGQIVWSYGLIPAQLYLKRLEDSLRTALGKRATRAMERRFPSRGVISSEHCGPLTGPKAADSVAGVDIRYRSYPPTPTRRP